MSSIKIYFFKWLCNIFIFADGHGDSIERTNAFFRVMAVIAPVSFALAIVSDWFSENLEFTLIAISFVLVNSFIGAIVHFINDRFQWEEFLTKTVKMLAIIAAVYFVLQGIISPVRDNIITEGFKASFKIATLLYPGSKILKNVFIWSKGEHPPKWIMQKVYNFQENGDLKAFLHSEYDKNNNEFND